MSAAGTFRLKAKQPFLSNALADAHMGLEEVGDGLWKGSTRTSVNNQPDRSRHATPHGATRLMPRP